MTKISVLFLKSACDSIKGQEKKTYQSLVKAMIVEK